MPTDRARQLNLLIKRGVEYTVIKRTGMQVDIAAANQTNKFCVLRRSVFVSSDVHVPHVVR